MTARPEGSEWTYLRIALGVVLVVMIADVVAWKVHDLVYPRPTRLERTVFCLKDNKGVLATVPAGDPIADSAKAGSLRATIETNRVTLALAKSEGEAEKIERDYRAVGTNLEGRLERRGRSVFLWERVASPTQRQGMYDCQY
jgi:hypothetical protein